MSRWRKAVLAIVVVAVAVPTLFVGAMYASAWYYRWRAQKFLAVVRNMEPGVTTETAYLKAVAPFNNNELKMFDSNNKPMPYNGAIDISNLPSLPEMAYRLMFEAEDLSVIHRLLPASINFMVIPSFQDGIVSELDVKEMMAVSGHPPGANVRWYAQRFEGGDSWLMVDSSGYHKSQMGVTNKAPWEFFIAMDERATRDERDHTLNLQFRCFTKAGGCVDAHEYLEPAPNRPGTDDNP